MIKKLVAATAAIAAISIAGCGGVTSGGPMPEFEGGTWIGSDALTMASLKGKVAWIECGFLG